jgi:hypothetical protein
LWLEHGIDAQGSIGCDRQVFSPVDCPPSPSGEDETNNDDDDDDDDDDSGNINKQIPSVLPFP